MQRDSVFDLIGVGFGPSNLALAVRLAEEAGASHLNHCFVERQPEFGWHRGMLLDDCRMQISFLKDLVTLRDPKSRFTFINYLFERGRLPDFVNLKSFYPTRVEFHDYLSWVAQAFDERVHYGETVVGIEPVAAAGNSGQVDALRVFSRDEAGREWQRVTHALSVGIGGSARIPEMFTALGPHNVIHTSNYLTSIGRVVGAPQSGPQNCPRKRIAVIGAGQSAAEVFVDLTRRYPGVDVSMVIRSSALKPADDSPFVNEIFSPAYTDIVYAQAKDVRRSLIDRFRDTNYAVVDRSLIEQIYEMLYLQNVAAEPRHRLLANTAIETAVRNSNGQVELTLRDRLSGHACAERFDALVLATGYGRANHLGLLDGLAPYLGDALAQGNVRRDYQLATPAHFKPRIYLQGCCEDSHGLSDTLLSVLALRSDEITASLVQGAKQERTFSPVVDQQKNGVGGGRIVSAL
jgi:L-ornithine N5-oxygenase